MRSMGATTACSKGVMKRIITAIALRMLTQVFTSLKQGHDSGSEAPGD